MKQYDLAEGMRMYIARLREQGRYSSAKSYQDALNSFKCFCGMEAIPYAYINRNRLLCYQSWLLDKGRSLNTVSTYMRRIRHIYNLAVEANEAPFVPTCSRMFSRAWEQAEEGVAARDAGAYV